MTLEEIAAGEQLMDIEREPSVPENMGFVFLGLIWPSPEALQAQLATAQGDKDLLKGTMDWIGAVLKPSWVAPDLRTRLRAARAIVSGQDAFLARYALNQVKIQIVVTRYHVHVVIKPPGGVNPLPALHDYLQVDSPEDPSPWSGEPWETANIAGLAFGYQMRGDRLSWRESVNYLTNSRAVKFSAEKIATPPKGSGPPKTGSAPTVEAESHWFAAKR
ncbi:MAG TPA: hypothetical protein VLY04_15415 [Bryobacteraceae bacterium]|nr:hypothetical protein [Bryobacteraceae bacterium]